MTSDEWQEGQRLLAAATPAPWISGEDHAHEPLEIAAELGYGGLEEGYDVGKVVADCGVDFVIPEETMVANRDLIIWLRNHVHELRPVSIVHTGDAPWPTTRPASATSSSLTCTTTSTPTKRSARPARKDCNA